MVEDASQQIANRIAKELGETSNKPKEQIGQLVELCGEPFAEMMLQAALDINAEGGMETQDRKRKRTVGGIFFYLARQAVPFDFREAIFPYQNTRRKQSLPEPIEWEERRVHFEHVIDKPKGKVNEVNIIVDGRPHTIEMKQGVVLATLEAHIETYQTFPAGVPDAPNSPTTFFVYVGEKQWKKSIGNKLEKDKDASVIVEGAPAYDSEMGGIAIFARSVKLRIGDSNRKEAQSRQKKREAKEKDKKRREEEAEKRREEEAVDLPDTMPDDIAKKLRPLYGALDLFKKRLEDIEAKPPEKQFGLKAAKMALERTEKQIEALKAQAENVSKPEKSPQEKDEQGE